MNASMGVPPFRVAQTQGQGDADQDGKLDAGEDGGSGGQDDGRVGA
jgi:hypothetical protein